MVKTGGITTETVYLFLKEALRLWKDTKLTLHQSIREHGSHIRNMSVKSLILYKLIEVSCVYSYNIDSRASKELFPEL